MSSDDIADNFLRVLDGMPDDWPTATVKLIDAMQEYLRTCEEISDGLLRDGTISALDAKVEQARLQGYRLLLRELEKDNVNPSLTP